MHVLITGAGGVIGRIVADGLKQRHTVRGFDRAPMPNLTDTVVGDVADLDTVRRATEGMDAVIHLAATHGPTHPWEETLSTNIIGTRNVFEAARENEARRIAFASRAGLLRAYPEHVTRTVDMLPLPRDSHYSVSKAFGEDLACFYANHHEMQIVCVRIGNLSPDRPDPAHPHHLGHDDCVHVFERAITQPRVAFEIVFGVSASNQPMYDLEHGKRAIGYEPRQYATV